MKIALITDTHWGVRNDNIAFMDNSKKFLNEVFFPYLDTNNVRTVVHLGDLVDRRKYLNHYTMHRLMKDFLLPMYDRDIQCHFIAGNHDTYYKNTNEINAIENIIGDRFEDFFTSYQRIPREFDFDGTTILMLPWICDENRDVCLHKIKTTPAQIVMGHLELAGFEMYRGSIVSHGDDRNLFDRFDMVLSGHYHHRSSDGTIHYLGSHAEFTWSDYDDRKGFHILDTETRDLTFIENPYIMFYKVWYDDVTPGHEPEGLDLSYCNGKIVKVIVKNKSDPYKFDMFIDRIEKFGVLEMQIVEDHLNLSVETDENIIDEAESTINIFKKYIDQVNSSSLNKEKLEQTIIELYQEAISVE
jgi:DNA repair exonuclease SbcCD nuclease subunit